MRLRQQILAASRREIAQLAGQPVSEVTPSRRDFAQYVATQKDDLAVIARLAGEARAQPTAPLLAHARVCDDAEVAALAVATGAGGLSAHLMAAVADAITAPVLRDDLLLDASQLYHARLHGADAVILPAAELDEPTLGELVALASSLHMAVVIETITAAHLAQAVRFPHAIIGVACTTADGQLDIGQVIGIAHQAPPARTLIALPEVTAPQECAALRGRCDAIVAGELLWKADDVSAVVQQLRGTRSG